MRSVNNLTDRWQAAAWRNDAEPEPQRFRKWMDGFQTGVEALVEDELEYVVEYLVDVHVWHPLTTRVINISLRLEDEWDHR